MEVLKTDNFADWIDHLRDVRARARIQVRLERLSLGNFGDVKSVGNGLSELRVHYGPGYRIYFKSIQPDTIVLLVGGNKNSQSADIAKAIRLSRNL